MSTLDKCYFQGFLTNKLHTLQPYITEEKSVSLTLWWG